MTEMRGPYAAAVARWETATRPAPRPTDEAGRLSLLFVEWMQGLAPGWVTATPGLGRPAQLVALGNGVVPQQAARALQMLSPPRPVCTQAIDRRLHALAETVADRFRGVTGGVA